MATLTTTEATANIDLTKVYKHVTSIAVVETSGSAATKVYFRNGAVGAAVYWPVVLPANVGDGWVFNPPLYFPAGVYVNVNAGAARISVTGY